MKPDVPKLLEIVAGKLLFEIAPNVQPSYRQSSVGLTGMLLTMVREEWERAVARRVEENTVLRKLFAGAAGQVADAELAKRLSAAASDSDVSLLVSEVDKKNDSLRGLLIDLHAHVESQDAAWARALDAEIWRELAASTQRRRFSLSPF